MKKINKATARRLFNQGVEITVMPCKCAIGSAWFTGARIARDYSDSTFDQIINAFTHYNCCYELGYYPAYYVEG